MEEAKRRKAVIQTDKRRVFAVLAFIVGALLSAWLGWNRLTLSMATTLVVAVNLPFVVRHGEWSASRLTMIAAETGYIAGAIVAWVAHLSGSPP